MSAAPRVSLARCRSTAGGTRSSCQPGSHDEIATNLSPLAATRYACSGTSRRLLLPIRPSGRIPEYRMLRGFWVSPRAASVPRLTTPWPYSGQLFSVYSVKTPIDSLSQLSVCVVAAPAVGSFTGQNFSDGVPRRFTCSFQFLSEMSDSGVGKSSTACHGRIAAIGSHVPFVCNFHG